MGTKVNGKGQERNGGLMGGTIKDERNLHRKRREGCLPHGARKRRNGDRRHEPCGEDLAETPPAACSTTCGANK